ncbi:MAG TPA: Mpo1-like protein [Vicinamibacteria bacterium]|nr:Mpo1-like protein [Vicinamibacteria bacterium]
MESARLSALFDDYARYHAHPMNKLCHYFGIPLIAFTVVGLLAKVDLGMALAVFVAVTLYQLTLSPPLTLGFALFLALSFLAAPGLSWGVLWAGFVIGWVLQFGGHYVFEKKSPAFFANLRQLLAGPLWVIASLMGMASSSRPEKAKS